MSDSTLEYFGNALVQARADNAKKVARKVWVDETTWILVWMTIEEAKEFDKLHRRVAQKSKLRNVLHGNGRLM